MSLYTVEIDGIKTSVPPGSTILDAAKKAGIWIPTLCYHPAIQSHATCRICMVELDRGDWKQLVTACNYPVRKDIKVSVNSKKASEVRKGVMELLMARVPDCKEIMELAKKMGVKDTPYPTVTESQRNCILCGMCIRICEEVIGKSAISFAGRGVERSVASPFRLASEDCIGCGACAVICPVGTIKLRLHEDTKEIEISPFKTKVKLLYCNNCGEKMISVPLNEKILKNIRINKDDLLELLRLCPKCRREKAASKLLVKAKP